MIRMIFCFVMMACSAMASSELMSEKSRKFWYAKADVVVTGKVVYYSSVYMSHGKVVSKEKAEEVLKKWGDVLDEFAGGIKDGGDEALRAFFQTDDGKIMGNLGEMITVGVEVDILHKGEYKKKTIFCSWVAGYLSNCAHVGVAARVGDEVSVYLHKMKDCPERTIIFSPSNFYLGPKEINKPE